MVIEKANSAMERFPRISLIKHCLSFILLMRTDTQSSLPSLTSRKPRENTPFLPQQRLLCTQPSDSRVLAQPLPAAKNY